MWEQIRANQIRSMVLVVGMAIVLVTLGFFLGLAFFGSGIGGLIIALVVWLIMNLVAYSQGDSILLSMSGAKKIERDDLPRLYNVVEEMKIASGLEKMPDIYIIDDPALNAFVCGLRVGGHQENKFNIESVWRAGSAWMLSCPIQNFKHMASKLLP